MGVVANVVPSPFTHVGRVNKVEDTKNPGRYPNGDQKEVNFTVGIKNDAGKNCCRHCARSPHRTVVNVILLLEIIENR